MLNGLNIPGNRESCMQRMALMGLVGVSMVGLGAGAWGLQARAAVFRVP